MTSARTLDPCYCVRRQANSFDYTVRRLDASISLRSECPSCAQLRSSKGKRSLAGLGFTKNPRFALSRCHARSARDGSNRWVDRDRAMIIDHRHVSCDMPITTRERPAGKGFPMPQAESQNSAIRYRHPPRGYGPPTTSYQKTIWSLFFFTVPSPNPTILFFSFRPEAMVGSSCRPLVALGYRGILAGGCGDAAVAAHDRETDLCHGEGILSSTCPGLHGRHPVGASRDPAERYVPLIAPSRARNVSSIVPIKAD